MRNQLKPIPEILSEEGYVIGTKEYRRAYERIRWSRRSEESRKNCGQAGHEYVRQRMERDPEYAAKMRARWKAQKKKQRQRRGEEINASQRKNYKQKRDHHLQVIYEGRNRRNPARGIATLLRKLEQRDLSPAEFLKHARALSTHAQRLINLIHSEVEAVENDYLQAETPEERTRKLSDSNVENVTKMGHQLLETIKLGVAVAGVKMQIERGCRNE